MYNIIATSLVLLLLTIPISCYNYPLCDSDYSEFFCDSKMVNSIQELPAFTKGRTERASDTWCVHCSSGGIVNDCLEPEYQNEWHLLRCCPDEFTNCWELDPLQISGLVIGVIVFIIICVWVLIKFRDNTNDKTNDNGNLELTIEPEPSAPIESDVPTIITVHAAAININSDDSIPIPEAVVSKYHYSSNSGRTY